jgi:hypothetical protein
MRVYSDGAPEDRSDAGAKAAYYLTVSIHNKPAAVDLFFLD